MSKLAKFQRFQNDNINHHSVHQLTVSTAEIECFIFEKCENIMWNITRSWYVLVRTLYIHLIPFSSAWARPALSVGCTCLQETSPGPPRGSSPLLLWLCTHKQIHVKQGSRKTQVIRTRMSEVLQIKTLFCLIIHFIFCEPLKGTMYTDGNRYFMLMLCVSVMQNSY